MNSDAGRSSYQQHRLSGWREVVLGPSSHVQGTILGRTGIAFDSGASLNPGRALAGIAVTLIANNIGQL